MYCSVVYSVALMSTGFSDVLVLHMTDMRQMGVIMLTAVPVAIEQTDQWVDKKQRPLTIGLPKPICTGVIL